MVPSSTTSTKLLYDVLIAQILFSEVEVNNGDEIKSDNNTIQGGDNTDEKNCKTQNLC